MAQDKRLETIIKAIRLLKWYNKNQIDDTTAYQGLNQEIEAVEQILPAIIIATSSQREIIKDQIEVLLESSVDIIANGGEEIYPIQELFDLADSLGIKSEYAEQRRPTSNE